MAKAANVHGLARPLVATVTTRADVDRRIANTIRVRDENADLPELVARLNDRLDLLHELRDAVPGPREAEKQPPNMPADIPGTDP